MNHRKGSKKLVAGLAAVTTAGLVGAGLVLSSGVASAAAALDVTYTCPFPVIDTQPISVHIDATIPDTIEVNKPTGAFDIVAITTLNEDTRAGLKLIKGAFIQGTAITAAHITAPGFDTDLDVEVAIEKTAIPTTSGAPFTVKATGKTPSLTFKQAGDIKITVHDIDLNITVLKTDGTLAAVPNSTNPFDSHCTQDAGINNVLKQGKIIDGGGGGTTTTTTSATTTSKTTTTTSATTTSATTTSKTTTTSGGGGGVKYGFNLSGKSNLVKMGGDVPLKGTIDANFNLSTGAYTADLVLNKTTANLNIMGFLNVVTTVDFKQIGQTTGTIDLGTGVLKSQSKMDIYLPSVVLFGFPISQGDTCKTSTPSDIALASPGEFDVTTGGKILGTYTIAKLQGCGGLNDWISAFAEGPGNKIDMNLVTR